MFFVQRFYERNHANYQIVLSLFRLVTDGRTFLIMHVNLDNFNFMAKSFKREDWVHSYELLHYL